LANIYVKFGEYNEISQPLCLPCAPSSNFAYIILKASRYACRVPCAPSSSSTSFKFPEKLQGNTQRNTATSKMAQTDDPTMAANSGSAQKGKLTSWQTEYVLRKIEENNLDRKLFIPQKQLWEKNRNSTVTLPAKAEDRLEVSFQTL
jgi:hypothetical protein